MCYGDDARPPLPPISGGSVAAGGDLTLEAADGNRFMAYAAHPANPTGAGVVILPDIRGLHMFYKELADQFAVAGFDAIAIDYFGRTAETDNRDESFAFRPHVEQTTAEGVDADAAAAIAHLRSANGGAVERVFSVGFCFGGAASWRQSATQPGLSGAIGFYGVPSRIESYIPSMQAPLLVLVAGADHTPVEAFEQFDVDLNEADVPHTMVVYDGAPHSFFDRTFKEHAEACEDAWKQMLAFIANPPAN